MILFNRNDLPELSDFHPATVEIDGKTYKDVVAAFQAGKQKDGVEDPAFYQVSKGDAKRLGKKVDIRPDWEKIKYNHMKKCLRAKFTQHPRLAEILLSTGQDWLVDDTTGWHDNVWGVCSCPACIKKPSLNLQGQALMEIRAELRGETGCPIYVDYVERDIQCEFDLVGDEVGEMKKAGTWAHTLNLLNRVRK